MGAAPQTQQPPTGVRRLHFRPCVTTIRRLEGHARARSTGRASAAAHLRRGTYGPAPASLRAVDELLERDGQRRITGPTAAEHARARVTEAIARQPWRPERAASTAAMVNALIERMDRDGSGLTCMVRAELAHRADRGLRTVTAVLAWLQRAGLLVVVEAGATAEFLGTDTNRAPTYAFTEALPEVPEVDHCHPPAGPLSRSFSPKREDQKTPGRREIPRCVDPRGRRLRRDQLVSAGPWPLRDVPTTVAERQQAAERLFDDLMVSAVDRPRLHRALVASGLWESDTACPATLAWAVSHHPDDSDRDLGPWWSGLGARSNRVAVLLARLAPWRGRLDATAVPAHVTGVDRVARLAALAARQAAADAADARPEVPEAPAAPSAARAAAMATIRAALTGRST